MNPVAVYGPCPAGGASLETGLSAPLIGGRLPIMPPGGFALVLTDSLASAQLLAGETAAGVAGVRPPISRGHVHSLL